MPSCASRYFGRLEWEEGAELTFPHGLPGFEQEKTFVAVQRGELKPLVFLQSVNGSGPCFVCLPARAAESGYELSVNADDLRALELPENRQPSPEDDVLCLAIVSFAEGRDPTANLFAPVLVNLRTRVAVQAVRADGRYTCREPLRALEEMPCS